MPAIVHELGQGNRPKTLGKTALSVILAQPGIHFRAQMATEMQRWTPAFARVTGECYTAQSENTARLNAIAL
jgi:hypothetical protein